ncbi:uncharacterized protein LOC128263978 [Drosophila gunungcola]|uniref:uncharacterized protein LOC128263978 n=1 Tax=Drosophila gunungcola TaxID=103775 RepID=UPI0022E8B722|nr:uncharacterized protein LOC128263978 [Drosophila gunungcola]
MEVKKEVAIIKSAIQVRESSRDSGEGVVRQRHQFRRRRSPHERVPSPSGGAGGRYRNIRIKKRMRVCVHTAQSAALRRTMGGRCEVCKAPVPSDGRPRPLDRGGARNSAHQRGGRAQLQAPRRSKQRPERLRGPDPGHLLIGGPLLAPPSAALPDQISLTCLRRWRGVSSLRHRFWQRWSREYISSLQQRSKWHQGEPNLVVGALVVVAEDNLPPQQWRIGRVVAVHAGADSKVRVADVRTQDGEYRRAVHRLALLPVLG